MFSSCLCSAQDQELIFLLNVSGSLSRFFLFLLLLLSPAPLSLQSPTPCLSSCLFACLKAASSQRQSRVAGCAAVLPPLFCMLPGPSPSLRTLWLFSIHSQAGTKIGYGATRTWAALRTPTWIEYSSGTGCSCDEPQMLTFSARKENVNCYSVLFSLWVSLLFMFLIPLLKAKKISERSWSFEDDCLLS